MPVASGDFFFGAALDIGLDSGLAFLKKTSCDFLVRYMINLCHDFVMVTSD